MSKNDYQTFVCVCCGARSDSLYKRYSPELIEVSKCISCGKIADAYIECDYIIILIDIILLRIEAFRHILFNEDFRRFWTLRLVAFCCLSEAYHHWALEHVNQQAITAAIEFSFYLKLATATIGIGVQVMVALLLLQCSTSTAKKGYDIHRLRAQTVALTNYSVLYLLVIHIWSPQSAFYGYYLLKTYNAATCFIAMRAVTDENTVTLMCISAVSCGLGLCINSWQ